MSVVTGSQDNLGQFYGLQGEGTCMWSSLDIGILGQGKCTLGAQLGKIKLLIRYDYVGAVGEGMEQRSFLVFSSRQDK